MGASGNYILTLQPSHYQHLTRGEREIRTPETLSRLYAFQRHDHYESKMEIISECCKLFRNYLSITYVTLCLLMFIYVT
jgi:hypothetical protein